MQTVYLIQIVPVGSPAQGIRLRGGGRAERQLIESVTAAVVAKGVGLFRTESQVKAAIRDGFTEVLRELKYDTLMAET